MGESQLLHALLDAAAEEYGDAVAVRHGTGSLSYASFRECSLRLAGFLAGRGLKRGDRLVVCLPADVLLPVVLFACSRVGAAFVVLRDDTSAVTAAHVLDDAEPALVLTCSPVIGALARARQLPCLTLTDLRTAATSCQGPRAAAVPGTPEQDDAACLIYTSGSTAMPKAVVSTHAQMVFAAMAIHQVLRYRRSDIVYCALPLSFDYGLYQIFLCVLAGAELVLTLPGSAGHRLLAGLRETGASVLPAVPSLAAILALLTERQATAQPLEQLLPRLRLLTSTGESMPPSTLVRLRRHLGGVHVRLMYGLTECKRATIMPPDEDLRRPGACGLPLPGTQVLITDPAGRPLPPGEIGEIVVRGPHVMAGYWRQPQLTAQRFQRAQGRLPQLRTGDYGWQDADGYLYFTGRTDGIYKERGSRVSVTEVEAAACRVPGVHAAAVVPPAKGGRGAILLAQTGLSPDEVLRAMRIEIDEVKIPARCVVIPDLPRNGHGKLDRSQLRSLLEEAG